MKKQLIYLGLLSVLIFSCDSSNEVEMQANEIKAITNTNYSQTENDSITILSREIFYARKRSSNNLTSKMVSYDYLISGNEYTDRKIFTTDFPYNLMLILQTDGNLCCYKVQKNTYPIAFYSSNPVVWSIGYSTNSIGDFTLANQSDGNVVNYKKTVTPSPLSTTTYTPIWSSNTTVADGSFENQVLEMIIYRKSTGIFGTNIKTFARLQIGRLPLGGVDYNFVSNIFDVVLQ